MSVGIKVQEARCRGCASCIKACPTEAMRIIDGRVQIIPELCIDCGECIRSCGEKAITLNEDDWRLIRTQKNAVIVADPTLYAQIRAYSRPDLLKEFLASTNLEDIYEWTVVAYDLAAYSIARLLEAESYERLPLISTYCPAVIRLIQINYPELVGRLVPVESPLETAVAIWREDTGRTDDVTLISPCPAKIALVRAPEAREKSNMSYAVSVQRVVRDILAGGPGINDQPLSSLNNLRWLLWSMTTGESKHIAAYCSRPLRTISVSGLRNTIDLLKDLELGRLEGVDYIECRACDLGCIGGVGNLESRFLTHLRLDNIDVQWELASEERKRVEKWHSREIWRLQKDLAPKRRLPLDSELNQAMVRLKEMNAIYAELPHIDCASCGRPSCRAMAEDIVRGRGQMTDCIFKLRERIGDLGRQIVDLSEKSPHAFSRRGR